jgi:hypothetical protein
VCHQDHELVSADIVHGSIEHLILDLHIESTQARVNQNDVGLLAIKSPSQGDSGFLTARQICAHLTKLCLISRWHLGQLRVETACLADILVHLIVHWLSKENVVLDCASYDQRLLLGIGDLSG